MRLKQLLIPLSCLFLAIVTSCSTQKNTWINRHYHELNTRYNVHFNGHESYLKGIKQLQDAIKYDYSSFLPLFQVSDHTAAKATSSNMDKTIKSCEKAIQKHSIRVKPTKKPTSRDRASKIAFYAQEEFNPFMDEVFILMAKAQYTKTDFESAIATCSYIIRHFSHDKQTCDKATLLQAQSLIETSWLYDAEQLLNKINTPQLTPGLVGEFSTIYADLLLRRKKYSEAIPYLEISIEKTKNRKDLLNRHFLLGQLYQHLEEKDKAYREFGQVIRMNPPYEMELNARIRQTEVFPKTNIAKSRKTLERMLGKRKNKDFLGEIYYAMGNLYMATQDTVKALETYQKALDKSSKNSMQKRTALMTMANIHLTREDFMRAEQYVTPLLQLLPKTDANHAWWNHKGEQLKMVQPYLRTIHREDSLQAVQNMPENERMALIDKQIEQLKAQIKEAEKKSESAETATVVNKTPTTSNITNEANLWYFNNNALVEKGLKEFKQKWNNRALVDDWRRTKKSSQTEPADSIQRRRRSTSTVLASQAPETETKEGEDDPLHPNYYLKDLPATQAQKDSSNSRISEALYQAGIVFWEQFENNKKAASMLERLSNEYPTFNKLDHAWFILYLLNKKQNNNAKAEDNRLRLNTLFPESTYAKRLENSLYIERMNQTQKVQDSLFEKAFTLFSDKASDSLFSLIDMVQKEHPYTGLMPRFLLLKAMEHAKLGHDSVFHQTLVDIQKNHPNSEIEPTVKALLEQWDAGNRPHAFNNFGLSTAQQEAPINELQKDSLSNAFQFNQKEAHTVLLICDFKENRLNELQFDVAIHNFTNYLIRDYELLHTKIENLDVLLITGFENASDAMRYISYLKLKDNQPETAYPGLICIPASDTNLKLLQEGASIKQYKAFFEKRYKDINTNF